MTDLEISRALALAIGWRPGDIEVGNGIDHACVAVWKATGPEEWDLREFDYRDPTVIWPIAEKYNRFPFKDCTGHWVAGPPFSPAIADTPAKAVAMAVIQSAKPLGRT